MSLPAERSAVPLIERVIDLVRQGSGVVAVLARRTETLDSWGRAFARRVRAIRGLSLEIYMPASSEALIERFNESLLGLSLEQARAEAAEDQPRRIVLVPDARGFDTPEGLLLARLTSDFPGAGTRLVILIDHDDTTRTERLLSALGRSVQRIDLDHMPAIQVSVPVESDRVNGVHQTVSRVPEARRGTAEQPIVIPAAGAGEEPFGAPRRSSMRWLGASVLVMALLLISALIVVLLHREPAPAPGLERRSASEVLELMPRSEILKPGLIGGPPTGA